MADGIIVNICHHYNSRWRIETGYRRDNQEITGRTTLHRDAICIFYLLLSVILKNVWTLLNIVQTGKDMSEIRGCEFAEELKRDVYTAYISSLCTVHNDTRNGS